MSETDPGQSTPSASAWDAPGENREEEFLFHFNRGGDLLQRGREDEARFHLEQAARLEPGNAKCQNLLGLLAYRQDRLEEAISIYDGLLERYPGDESLSLNLATVLIKAGQSARAEELLSTLLENNPSHRRAQAMLQALRGKDGQERAPGAVLPASGERAEGLGPMDWQEPFRRQGSATAGESGNEQPEAAVTRAGPFIVEPAGLLVEGVEDFCCRLDHLVQVQGEFEYQPLRKRYRGRDTRWLFGGGSRVMCRVQGLHRAFFISPPGGGYQLVELAAEAGFFREENVIAFAGGRQWENGRLRAGGDGNDMHVFHMTGPGVLVLACRRGRWFPVAEEQPLRVKMSALLGWRGELEPSLLQQQVGHEDVWALLQGRGAVLLGNP